MIHLRNVEKRYARGSESVLACAVDRLDIAPGEQVALVGRSGTGKTTLLHILAGILRPDCGEVEVAGARLDQLGESARDRHRGRHIGMVYQTFNLLQPFTALENVLLGALFGRGAGGDARARAESLLQKVGLGERMAGELERRVVRMLERMERIVPKAKRWCVGVGQPYECDHWPPVEAGEQLLLGGEALVYRHAR